MNHVGLVSFFEKIALCKASTRQPGNFNDPRILWIHLHSYGGTTMCDLARAHGEKVSPPKDNCTLEIEVIYGFFISSSQKKQNFWVNLWFWKEHIPYWGNVMPDGCSTPKSFRIPCRKRAATLVELGVKCWVFVAKWIELTDWFSKRWNPPIAWAYPKIS